MAKQFLECAGAADISQSSDTTNFTVEMPRAGVLRLDECWLRWTEATGTQSTTQGVVSLEVAGVEVATLTANISDGVGESQDFTAAGDQYIEFAAAADIECITKTIAVDGTIGGDGTIYLSIEMGT